MKFDHEIFFEALRSEFSRFKNGFKQYQVEGLEAELSFVEKYDGWWDSIPQIANMMSQTGHETADAFLPVVEGYYLGAEDNPPGRAYFSGDSDRVRRFQRNLRYYPDFGRGRIQLTWDYNYEEQDELIRKYFPEIVAAFNARSSTPFDLKKHPEQMLDDQIDMCVVTIGMHKGTFRDGHMLDRYINRGIVDHNGARNIVNGDRRHRVKGESYTIGEKIERDAVRFERALKKALIAPQAAGISPLDVDRAQVVKNPLEGTEPLGKGVKTVSETTTVMDRDVETSQTTESVKTVSETTTATEKPLVVVTEEKTNFMAKFTAILTGIFTGAYTLPKLDPSSVDLIKALFPYLVIAAVIGLGIWYFTKKTTNFARLKLLVDTNADQTKRDVIFQKPEPAPSVSKKIASLFSYVVYFTLIALVLIFVH